MARIRSIKPELWLSPQVMNLSHSARLLWIGLITQADDFGRGSADPRRLKAAIFPGDDITAAEVDGCLDAIGTQQLIVLYDGGKHGRLYAIPSWKAHQRISHPADSSRYPEPSRNVPGTLTEDSSGIYARADRSIDLSKDLSRARARPLPEAGPRAIGDALAPWVEGGKRA